MPEGDLGGLFGEMVVGRLEKMAAARAAQYAGQQVFGQVTPQQMQEMPEYFKSGAPYGPTREGMMRWINERAAAANPAAADPAASQAGAKSHHKHAAPPAPTTNAVASTHIRSFADGHTLRSFAENEHIRSFGEHS